MGLQAESARASSPRQDAPAGRDAQGRFTQGNRGGPGNPFARQVAALRKVFVGAVSHEELRHICQRLVAQAMLGHVPSAKVVLGYVLGRIPDPVNPDRLDQEECEQFLDNPTYGDIQEMRERRPPADLSAAMMRSFHIVQTEQARQILRHGPDATAVEPGAAAPEGAEPTTPPGTAGPGLPEPQTRRVKRAPSSNGSNGRLKGPPSPNGPNGSAQAPSTNGDNGSAARPKSCAPSPNRDNGRHYSSRDRPDELDGAEASATTYRPILGSARPASADAIPPAASAPAGCR